MVVTPNKMTVVIQDASLSLTGNLQNGQASRISEDIVLAILDLLVEAFELGAILRHGTSYEHIDLLTRLQITAITCMTKEHADRAMVQRAITSELESDEEATMRKSAENDRRGATTSSSS